MMFLHESVCEDSVHIVLRHFIYEWGSSEGICASQCLKISGFP